MQETGIFRFSDIEVRPSERMLLKAGEPVAIEPKAFRLLVYLLQNRGRLVTKEELLNAVWDDVSVSENSLTRSIASLRRQLGDDAKEPRFIATVHTAGYRFVCPLEIVGEDGRSAARPAPGVELAEEKLVARQRWGSRWVWLAVMAVLVLSWMGVRMMPHRDVASRHYRVAPVTHLPGAVNGPAISPDGKQVAFFWEPGVHQGESGPGQERSGLYVQLVDGSQPLRLTESKGGFIGNAAWSPDGRQIAYGRCDDDGAGIYTVSALGGPEHKVTDVSCLYGDPGHAQWTRDGKALVLVDRCGPEQAGGVVLFSFETGKKRCLSSPPPGNETDVGPVLSPDGQTVAFIRMSSSIVGDIYTVPLAGGEVRRLSHETNAIWQLMWSADGRSVVFRSEGGIDGLQRIPAQGGTIEAETGYPGVGSLSSDGSRLVYVEPAMFWASASSIWRADLSKVGGSVLRMQQVIASNSFNSGPQVSPDNSALVFQSVRSGASEIWKSHADGSDPVQLTSFGGHTGTPRWSPDGKWIVFDCRPKEHSEIWIMDPDGRNAHVVISGGYENVVPNWSRDGKTILFASNRTGQYQVWARDMGTGLEKPVTSHGGFASFESPDGKSLLYTKFDRGGIWTVPRNGGAEVRLAAALHLGYWGYVAVTDKGIYFLDSDAPDGPTIEYYSFQSKTTEKVFALGKDQSAVPWEANLAASPDGRTIYFVQGSTKSSIVMAEFGR